MSLLRYLPEKNVYSFMLKFEGVTAFNLMFVAMTLFYEMKEKGILPNFFTYNCLIHGLRRFGRWKEATRMFREMSDIGISPDVTT